MVEGTAQLGTVAAPRPVFSDCNHQDAGNRGGHLYSGREPGRGRHHDIEAAISRPPPLPKLPENCIRRLAGVSLRRRTARRLPGTPLRSRLPLYDAGPDRDVIATEG